MSFWAFKNETSETEAELTVYGDIGEWLDVDSRKFTRELKQITAKQISVRINSGGGSVFTAQAILSSLRRHKAEIIVYIDGIAASAASVIAMAGDLIVMPSNAMMMIHNPSIGAWGESKDMRKTADILDKVRDTIVAAYKEKTGLEESKIVDLMNEETWLTANEAVELGFADEVENYQDIAASMNSGTMFVNGVQVDASNFKNLPQSWFKNSGEQPENVTTNPPGGKAGESEETEIEPMNLEELKAKHPDLYAQVIADAEKAGVEKERARIQSIEDMAMPGHDDLIADAKFKSGITAEALAVSIVKAEKQRGKDYLASRQDDAEEIETPDPIDAADQNPANSADEKERQQIRAAAAEVGSKRKPSMFRKGE